jgi:O-antigen biosynthesis protein
MVEGARGRAKAVLKGRSISQALTDVVDLAATQGLRGITHRTFHELRRDIPASELEPPPEPAPATNPTHTHSFHVARNEFYNPSARVLELNGAVVDRFDNRLTNINSATWFVPWFEHVYFGGIHTILRFMSWMRVEHGVEPRLVVYDNPVATDDAVRSQIKSAFPELADIDIVVPPGHAPYVDFDELPPTDIALCTIWYSAYALLRFNTTKAKFYFVQDFEPAFYPAGVLWAMAEATYRFGFAGLVNTPGLGEVYSSYGNPSCSFVPAVDVQVPRHTPSEDRGRGPVEVVLYGRPSTDRNGFELLAAMSHLLKDRFKDKVHIVAAGEEWDPSDYELKGVVDNVGLLPTLKDVRELYSRSDIGVCCMFSKHPSYQPFEYMAAGMAVVTNVNTATQWLFHHEDNCLLSEPFAVALADAVGRLVQEPELRMKLASAGFELSKTVTWDEEFQKLWEFVVNKEPS